MERNPNLPSGPAPCWPDLARIRDYYDATWHDYRLLWLNRENRAIHFGYWDADTRTHAQALLHMNRALARATGIEAGQRILDAGCGVGGSAIWLAKTYSVEVVGITPVPSQVRRAQRYAREHGVAGRVSFQERDYTRTGFAPQSFDVIWALESVCHAPDKLLFLQEAHRLLRPDGRLGLVEYMRSTRPLAAPAERQLHRWLSGWAIPDLGTSDELLGWAEAAGFRSVRLEDITPRVLPSLRRLHRMATALWPIAAGLHALHLRGRAAQGNIRGARDQYTLFTRGLVREQILTAGLS